VRINPELGGGSIWDIGCYPISYARFIAGSEPLEVFGWQVIGHTGTDDSFIGQMRFPGEVYAQFDCSFKMQHRTYMEIAGSKGTITLQRPFTPLQVESILLKQGDKTSKVVIRSGHLYTGEIEDMHDVVLTGKAPRVSLQDSRGTVLAITSLLQSAKEKKPIGINPTDMICQLQNRRRLQTGHSIPTCLIGNQALTEFDCSG
jgi:D-xylose 1-dehydrogenase (NADP+, D-xylono-1,5-lactone-forming)